MNELFSDESNEISIKNAWKFYTKINPHNEKPTDPLSKAFELFINELLLSPEEISKIHIKKFIINTNGDYNNIIIENCKTIFYKNIFLKNKKFKQKLIDYYNSYGIFVKGPKEIIKSDGVTTGTWIIELNKINVV